MTFASIERHASTRPADVMGRTPGVSRSGRYDWRGRAPGARTALFGCIEGSYNRHRMHSALGDLTPGQAAQSMTG